MTPNKLPPLPVPKHIGAPGIGGTCYYTEAQMHAYAAEALRQSQSLPSGAVGEVVAYLQTFLAQCQREHTARCDQQELAELIAALQADAREKGEAVEHLMSAIRSVALSGDYGISDEAIGVLSDAMDDVDSGAVGATQPAQASEKDNG